MISRFRRGVNEMDFSLMGFYTVQIADLYWQPMLRKITDERRSQALCGT
jgi:hypothetical protein